MFLGLRNDLYDNLKLLWSDNMWVELEDDGAFVGELINAQLLSDYGIRVTSAWRFEIEYFEADCEIATPMDVNDLTLP